jgi:hypothetical protein
MDHKGAGSGAESSDDKSVARAKKRPQTSKYDFVKVTSGAHNQQAGVQPAGSSPAAGPATCPSTCPPPTHPPPPARHPTPQVKVWLGEALDRHYVLSRVLISRMLTVTKIPYVKVGGQGRRGSQKKPHPGAAGAPAPWHLPPPAQRAGGSARPPPRRPLERLPPPHRCARRR